MIRLEHTSKMYGTGVGRRVALDGIDLQVEAGEFLSIVGSSGSGKTTLLNLLGGLDRPSSGRVFADGMELSTLDDRSLSHFRNRTVGFIFQHFNLLEHLSCLENVTLPGHFGLEDTRQEQSGTGGASRRALELMERFGIGQFAHELPGRLSGGQKQRVAIARALFCRPRLLLCDEPTGNLDSRTGNQIFDHITRLNREDGLTVVLVTHQLGLAQRGNRIISLEDGRIVSDRSEPAKGPAVEDEGGAAPEDTSRGGRRQGGES